MSEVSTKPEASRSLADEPEEAALDMADTASETDGADAGPGPALKRGRSRSVLWLSGLIIVCLVLGLSFAGAQSFRDLSSARARADELEREIGETQHAVEELSRTIEDLRTSSETIERLAREDLGLVRPDEIVIVLPDDSP